MPTLPRPNFDEGDADSALAVKAYRDAVRAKPGIQTVLLPIGQGVKLSYLWGDAPASHL